MAVADGWRAKTVHGAKRGRVAMVVINVTAERDTSAQTVMGTMSEAYAPATTAALSPQVPGGYAGYITAGTMAATLAPGSTVKAGTTVYLLGTYITAS